MADQAFKNVVGFGPEPYPEDTGSGFDPSIGSMTAQYTIANPNLQQAQPQQDSIMNFMPENMIESFNNQGYRDYNNVYGTFFRQADSFLRA